ncbi:MAG TPA: MBL fold metallo-hydrolase [Chthoniobacterales bacterium]|nr:MBL fold metallo-hydrolase [Chthoniobacterales bacterium]
MTLRFWGVRGSIPSPSPETTRYGGNTSCIEVRAGDQILILDCGSGLRALGAALAAEFKPGGFNATILISHTHWDHIQGLPFFAPAYAERNHLRIFAQPGSGTRVQKALNNQMEPMHFPVRFGDLPGIAGVDELPKEGKEFGALMVRTINLNHPGGCAGFRFEANGTSVAYLPDHEPYHSCTLSKKASAEQRNAQARLVKFVRGCDVLILDTQYDEAEYATRIGWGHGCIADSIATAVAADVGELVCFHHDPAHCDTKINDMVSRGRQLARDHGARLHVRGAREGEQLLIYGKRAATNGLRVAAA